MLAPTLDTPHAQRVRALMERYDGVHLACFGTPDAAAEHARLGAHGFEPEPLVDLRKDLETGERGALQRGVRAAGEDGRRPRPVLRAPHARSSLAPSLATSTRHRPASGLCGRRRSGAGCGALGALRAACCPGREGGLRAPGTARAAQVVDRHATRSRANSWRGARRARPRGLCLSCRDPEAFAARCTQSGSRCERPRPGTPCRLPAALGGDLAARIRAPKEEDQ